MRKKNEIRRNYEEESKAEDQVPSARERKRRAKGSFPAHESRPHGARLLDN